MSDIKYYYDLEQGTNEWLRTRLGIITASVMHQLVTPKGKIADNNDSRGIIYEKVSERVTGEIGEFFTNAHMDRGNTFEPFARDLYSDEIATVKECGFITRKINGVTIGYSPDGLIGDDGLIEIKCPNRTKHVKEIIEGLEPKAYLMQMHTGMLVTDRDWCDYVGYYDGMPMRTVRIERDPAMDILITNAATVFEECVREKIEIYKILTKNMQKSIKVAEEVV